MKFTKGENRFYREDEGGNVIAEVKYQPVDEDTIDLTSTFVDESLRGQGIAEQLVNQVVEEAEKENKKIIPTCSYAESLFEKKEDKYKAINAKA